jgi:hypothetical protein
MMKKNENALVVIDALLNFSYLILIHKYFAVSALQSFRLFVRAQGE